MRRDQNRIDVHFRNGGVAAFAFNRYINFVGAGHVHGSPADVAGHAGVRLRAQLAAGDVHHALDAFEDALRTDGAVEPYHVGAQSLDRPLFPLFTRSPLYPAARLDALELGEADIEVTIDRAGRVRLPHIRAATQPEFGWAAATAVSQWLFETPLKEGKPVDVRVVIPIKFKPPEQ